MRVRATASSVEVWAPAKLNLFLRIRGKRSDGYHEIETLMVPITLYDTLLISPTEPAAAKANIQLTIDSGEQPSARTGEDVAPATAENTVLQAVGALREMVKDAPRADLSIHLTKRIPVAAGLAGGSSDAAAALRAFAVQWQLSPEDPRLHAAAAQVGSDVPFFLSGGSALCTGRGEEVERCPLPRLHFVVAKPAIGLSTADVYRACAPSTSTFEVRKLVAALWAKDRREVQRCMHNGLQPAAKSLSDTVERMQREFAQEDVIAHQMSGSGTSYFGICASAGTARKVAARMKARRIGHVFAVSSCL